MSPHTGTHRCPATRYDDSRTGTSFAALESISSPRGGVVHVEEGADTRDVFGRGLVAPRLLLRTGGWEGRDAISGSHPGPCPRRARMAAGLE